MPSLRRVSLWCWWPQALAPFARCVGASARGVGSPTRREIDAEVNDQSIYLLPQRPGGLAAQGRIRFLDGIFDVVNDPPDLINLLPQRGGLAAQGLIRLLDGVFVILDDPRYLLLDLRFRWHRRCLFGISLRARRAFGRSLSHVARRSRRRKLRRRSARR